MSKITREELLARAASLIGRADLAGINIEGLFTLEHLTALDSITNAGPLTVTVKVDDTMLDEIRGQLDEGERIILDVARERMRQDEQWGGSRHDDTHHAGEWLQYIGKQQVLAVNETIADDDLRLVDPQGYRERLVKIAALAVAALQSHDRKNA